MGDTNSNNDKIVVYLDTEETIVISRGRAEIVVKRSNLNINVNSTFDPNYQFSIVGIAGSMFVSEKELNLIFSEFKRFNKGLVDEVEYVDDEID